MATQAELRGSLAAVNATGLTYHRQSRAARPDGRRRLTTDLWNALAGFVILDAIRGLPEAYRETLILRLVEGMTGPEIAERTGLTHQSVRV